MKVAIEFSENQRLRTVVEINDDEFEAWSVIQDWPSEGESRGKAFGREFQLRRFLARRKVPYHLMGNVDHLAIRRDILAVAVL